MSWWEECSSCQLVYVFLIDFTWGAKNDMGCRVRDFNEVCCYPSWVSVHWMLMPGKSLFVLHKLIWVNCSIEVHVCTFQQHLTVLYILRVPLFFVHYFHAIFHPKNSWFSVLGDWRFFLICISNSFVVLSGMHMDLQWDHNIFKDTKSMQLYIG